ncbi:MAG: hypothetical protein Q9219_000608 [cf. Caloplaca sp. 3 TL-2023]
MLPVAGGMIDMKHHPAPIPSGDVDMMTDRLQVLNAIAGNAAARNADKPRAFNTPRWLPNSSMMRMCMAACNKGLSPSVNMPDADVGQGPSPSLRNYIYQFNPQIDIRAVQLSDEVSGNYETASSTLSVSASTHNPVERISILDSSIPRFDDAVEAERQRLEQQVKQFLASVDRDLYGCNPRPAGPKECGEFTDNQNHDHKSLKRGRSPESEKPVKRARQDAGQHFDMMSNLPAPGKRFYNGPGRLKRAPLHDQDSYIPIKRLGTGGQGTAHLLRNTDRNSLVVCKVIPHTRNHKYHQSELAFLRDALPPHSRIIQIHSALIGPRQTQLYLDYCDGGDLQTFMDAYHFGPHGGADYIPESFIWHAFLQMAEALAYVHHGYDRHDAIAPLPSEWYPVIHRDIKPANILLQRAPPSHPDHPGPEPYPRLVLADFGLALQATRPNVPPTSHSPLGTYAYQPPEFPTHSAKGDVWSLGSVIFAMCTARLPFDEGMPDWVDDIGSFREWHRGLGEEEKRTMFVVGREGYSDGLDEWVGKALAMDVGRRVGSLELVKGVEGCKARKGAGWEELGGWVWGGG